MAQVTVTLLPAKRVPLGVAFLRALNITYIEIDGLRVSNTCFADADLYWAWLVRSLRVGLDAMGGLLLAGGVTLFFACQARRIAWPVAGFCAAAGLAAVPLALFVHNGAYLSALSWHLPGVALCVAAVCKAYGLGGFKRCTSA